MIQKIILKSFLVFIFSFLNQASISDEWFTSSTNYESSKYSSLDQINDKNTNKLKTAWIYKNGFVTKKINNLKNNINNQSIPIYTGKHLIVTSLDDYIIALNPGNGQEIWRSKIAPSSARRGLTYFKENLFIPSAQGVFVIKESDGNINNKYGKEGFIGSEIGQVTLVPPIVKDNEIIVAFRNSVASFSLPSGNLLWKKNLNGARIWSGVSYDDETETLIFVTSNLVHLVGDTNIENDFSNSVVLLDTKSGEVRCKFKDTIHDHWDLDMVGNPIIVNSTDNEISLKTVYGLSKTGNTFVINLKDCKLLNENHIEKIEVESISPIEGQIYSDYQIKITNPANLMNLDYDLQSYLNYIFDDKKNYEYVKHITRNSKSNAEYIPLSFDHDVIMMGLHGGPEWQGGTHDKLNDQIIIPTNHYPWFIRAYYSCCNKKKVRNAERKFNETLISIKEFRGYNVYKEKCLSCHGKNKNGLYKSELFGDTYYPSLNGISKLNKLDTLKNLEKFLNAHKYTEKIEIDEIELENLKNYLLSRDNYLFSKELLEVRGVWQLLLDQDKNFASIPPYGKITSISINTGLINWQIPFGTHIDNNGNIINGSMNFGGVLSTEGNLLFATGSTDKKIYIYNSTTGEEIWSHKLEYAGSSAPMTYFYKGKQYIIVNSSGGKYYGYEDELGDVIHAFRIF